MKEVRQILDKLYYDIGEFAGDMMCYDQDIKFLSNQDIKWLQSVQKYNEACVIKRYIEELIDFIEEDDDDIDETIESNLQEL